METDSNRLVANRISYRKPTDPFTTPCYDGKDTSLKEEPYCFTCRSFQDQAVLLGLKRCSRCKMAWYCDARCQKKHFKHHRELCNSITEARKRVELTTIRLQNSEVIPDDRSAAPPAEIVDCVDAHSDMAGIYWKAAYEREVKEVWEAAKWSSTMIFRCALDFHSFFYT